MKRRDDAKRDFLFFFFGILVCAVMLVPYLALGKDAIFAYHDQLDGEMIAYILQAKHLASGGWLPEFMGGSLKSALMLPAPMCVLLFLPGNDFAALVVMQLVGSLTGYVGMYLLGRDLTGKPWIGMAAGVLFSYLPFLPVYGLSQYGIPLLMWCFWQLGRGRYKGFCVLYAALYALNSSLVLVGFAVLGLLIAAVLLLAWRKKEWKGPLAAWAAMLVLYVVENLGLLKQVFGGGEVSNKAEYVLHAEPFWGNLWTFWVDGGQHSEDYHRYILALGLAVLAVEAAVVLSGRRKRKPEESVQAGGSLMGSARAAWRIKGMLAILGLTGLFALAAAFWGAGPGVAFRSRMNALRGFQLSRVLWLSSTFWYLLLTYVLDAGGELAAFARDALFWHGSRKERWKAVCCAAAALAMAAVVALVGIRVAVGSNLKPNVQKLRNPEYSMLSYRDYYALGVMEQVRAYLEEASGQPVDEYRVASLGIDPAAAYHAGFYCLDGYSNNYSLDYKHQFRRIIAPELDKSDYLKTFFDYWGNRCYLFSAEVPAYYTIEKNGFVFQDYAIDIDAFVGLGGRYLLAAGAIQDSEKRGLRLMREEPFETPESYYRIYLYEAVPMNGG